VVVVVVVVVVVYFYTVVQNIPSICSSQTFSLMLIEQHIHKT
jgi:hypothetical protein